MLVVSQATFDAVVEENMEEFGMGEEEALAEAVEQLAMQGGDLGDVLVVSEDRGVARRLRELEERLRTGREVESVLREMEDVLKAARKDFKVTSQLAPLVNHLASMCSTNGLDDDDDDDSKEEAWTPTVYSILERLVTGNNKRFKFRSHPPPSIYHGLLSSLESGDVAVRVRALDLIYALTRSCEANKRVFYDNEIDRRMESSFLSTMSSSEQQRAADDFLRSYSRVIRTLLSDDDREEGIHPETFKRAREMGERFKQIELLGDEARMRGLLAPSSSAQTNGTAAGVLAACKAVFVNDSICAQFLREKDGTIVAVTEYLARADSPELTAQAYAFLRYLARSDKVKTRLGRDPAFLNAVSRGLTYGDGTPLDWRVRTEAARAVGVVLLRQYELSTFVASFEGGEILEGLSRMLVDLVGSLGLENRGEERAGARKSRGTVVRRRGSNENGMTGEVELEGENEGETTAMTKAHAGRAALIALRQFVAHPSCATETRPLLFERGVEARALGTAFPEICAECAEDLMRDLGYEDYKIARFSSS